MSENQLNSVGGMSVSGVVDRLRQSLLACSEASETGNFQRSDEVVSGLVDFLNSIAESAPPSDTEEDSSEEEKFAEVALLEIHKFLSSLNSNQMAVDVVALAVPMVVAKLGGMSERCREMAESVIECLVSVCHPRDLLSILCEALDSLYKVSKAPTHFILLLSGLKKVLSSIKRQPVQQLKIALPVIIRSLHGLISDPNEKHKNSLTKLFSEATEIAKSIEAICENSTVGKTKEVLHAILGLYVLQLMALLSKSSLANDISCCGSIMLGLSYFLPTCGLSYIGIITGSDVDAAISNACDEDDDNFRSCFSFVNDGASLAVIWGCISGEIVKASGEELITVLDELRSSYTKRWQAIVMLRHVLSSIDYPWGIKGYAIDLILSIMDQKNSGKDNEEHVDKSSLMVSLYACLQAIEKVVIYAPDGNFRKKAFAALKKVLADLPSSQHLDMLKALITNTDSPSMTAILIDLVKDEVLIEFRQRVPPSVEVGHSSRIDEYSTRPLWSSGALDLIEMILRPPRGGPPSLPEQSEPILSALNLYRFILLTETAGKTNYSGVLSENTLRKAYIEWLLPLRTLVSGIDSANKDDDSDIACNILCVLNPLQLVLYRCIELVEDKLKHLK